MIRNKKGFTLLEVMITVAIIAIITATAIPSFERYQQKNRRTDGMIALLQNSSQLEKCFLNTGTYEDCPINSPSPKTHYAITGALAAESFTLTATAQGAQAGDECTTLTLDNMGQKDYSGSAPNVKRCWSQ
jgi:type IV pilus assembly protein PilE